MDVDKSYVMLEWGLNWVIVVYEVSYVIVYVGVLVKDNKVILLFVYFGLGKSIISCVFMKYGWCFLFDEFVFIMFNILMVILFVRLVCLKNVLVDIVSEWLFEQVKLDIVFNMYKGDVVYLVFIEILWCDKGCIVLFSVVVFFSYRVDIYCEI